jgi:hypothetical protein
MQLLVDFNKSYVNCPVCHTRIARWFIEGYPDYAAYLHSGEHIRVGLDTPESYNDAIAKYVFPDKPYELYTDLSTDLST